MKLASQVGVCAMLIALTWQSKALAGDTLLIHGHIYTGNPRAPWASAVSVSGTRIEAIGTDAAVLINRSSRTQVIDLHGQTVIPGIVDSHTHVLYGAYALHGLNLSAPESSISPEKAELLVERLKAYAAAHPQDAVLFGRADFSTVPPSTPTHALLDRAVADRPVVIHNTSEHAVWLNSAALQMAGVTDRPVADSDEERGVIRDASGHPSGVLLEAAMQLAARAVAVRVPLEDKLAMVQAATRYLNSMGITSVVNATGDLAEIELYGTLRDRGTLTVRTRTSFGSVAVQHHLTPEFLADLERARQRYHDDWGNFDPADEVPSDRWRSLQASGAVLAFSSDWPCTWPPDPFVSIQQAATRQVWKSADTANIAGEPLDGAGQGGARVTGATYIPGER